MQQPELVPSLAIGTLLSIISLSGLFGGYVAALLDNIGDQDKNEECNNPDKCSKKCNNWYFFRRSMVGIAGAFAAVFAGMTLKIVTVSQTNENIIFLTSLCVVAGTISYRLLRRIGSKLLDQLAATEEKAALADKKAENAIKISEKTSVVANAEKVINSTTIDPGDVRKAITDLEELKPKFPADRAIHISLGRIYKVLGQYDKAIKTLENFINGLDADELNNGEKYHASKYAINKADAYFNIACYYSLKAKQLSQQSPDAVDEKESLITESLRALEKSINIWDINKEDAKFDSDFDFIRESARFKELTS